MTSTAARTLAVLWCTALGCTPISPPGKGAGNGTKHSALPRLKGDDMALPQPEPKKAGSATPLVVHEWGTFTSVQGSDGVTLKGLHHDEEPLPSFVHGRDPLCTQAKCLERLPEAGVTQKMETPVIYFHSERALDVTVTVGFPQGVISQWYPAHVAASPAPGQLEDIAGGSMTWNVTLNPGPAALPPVPPGDIWEPSREVDCAPLTAGGEHEKFIFYRGLGRFDVPLRVTSTDDGTLTVHNDSGDLVPAVFLLNVDESGGAVSALGPVGPNGAVSAPAVVPPGDLDLYVAVASGMVAGALEATGLYPDEALAMVRTWEVSYFHTPGLRVLYVLPAAWTASILPMALSPAPDALVRTLVGRVEVMTPAEETWVRDLLLEDHAAGVPPHLLAFQPWLTHLGRYAEAKVRRARVLLEGSDAASWIDAALPELVRAP